MPDVSPLSTFPPVLFHSIITFWYIFHIFSFLFIYIFDQAQDLAWDPCFCDMSIAEACDPTRLEHEFGIRGADVQKFSVALATARELRRWIELQSLGFDERLANESYRYLRQYGIGAEASVPNGKGTLHRGASLSSLNIREKALGSSASSFTLGAGSGGIGGRTSPSSSFYHNRLIIEKKVGIESLQSDLSDLLIKSGDALSDEVLYQAFKDAGVMHPGERLRMVASLRASIKTSSTSSTAAVAAVGAAAGGNSGNVVVGMGANTRSNSNGSTGANTGQVHSPKPFKAISSIQPPPFDVEASSVGYNMSTPSPASTPPPSRAAPPPPSGGDRHPLTQPPPPASSSSSFHQLQVTQQQQQQQLITPTRSNSGHTMVDLTPSMPLTPYERSTQQTLRHNNAGILDIGQPNNSSNSNSKGKQGPDRSIATTYYCVKASAGGRKTCKVSWTPPTMSSYPSTSDDEAAAAARMFVIVSKSPDLLNASKTEFLVPLPLDKDGGGGGDDGLSGMKKSSKVSLKFIITPPTPPPFSTEHSAGINTILEAIAEIYEVKKNGVRVAVDLLEFAVHVTP
jgi:hypothetical protein